MNCVIIFCLIHLIHCSSGAAIDNLDVNTIKDEKIQDRQISNVGSAIGAAVGTTITATSQIVGAIVLPLANAVGPITGTIFNQFVGPQGVLLRNDQNMQSNMVFLTHNPFLNQYATIPIYGIANLPNNEEHNKEIKYLKSSLIDLNNKKLEGKSVSYAELVEHFGKLYDLGVSIDTLEHAIEDTKSKKGLLNGKIMRRKE